MCQSTFVLTFLFNILGMYCFILCWLWIFKSSHISFISISSIIYTNVTFLTFNFPLKLSLIHYCSILLNHMGLKYYTEVIHAFYAIKLSSQVSLYQEMLEEIGFYYRLMLFEIITNLCSFDSVNDYFNCLVHFLFIFHDTCALFFTLCQIRILQWLTMSQLFSPMLHIFFSWWPCVNMV